MRSLPERYCPVRESSVAAICVGRPRGHHETALLPGPGSQIHHVIRPPDGLLVMLDHQHGILQVAQSFQGFQQSLVVARVQADARFVEHIQHAAQFRPDLRGQPDSLALAARERGG